MNRYLLLLILVAPLILNACAGAKSQYVNGERVRGAKLIRNNPDAHDRPILMLKGELPKKVKIEALGEVRSGNQFYGSLNRVMEDLAYKARLAGADAVININIKYRMTAMAYAAGSAAGVAVKIVDDGGVDLAALPGATWRMGKWIPDKKQDTAPQEESVDEAISAATAEDQENVFPDAEAKGNATGATPTKAVVSTFSNIEVKEDRFDGGLSIKTKRSGDCHASPCFMALAIKKRDDFINSLTFYKVSTEWRYLRCYDVKWLVDNKRLETPEGERTSSGAISGGSVFETISQMNVPLPTIKIIANASKAEYRICNDEFELSASDKVKLKEFVEKAEELSQK